MEAVSSLMRGVLPPAGNRLSLRTHASALPEFKHYYSTWVDSGTSALALALLTAKQARTDIIAPEVIVPAYCCPDLVAAAVHAGITPVAVDISPSDPAYHHADLKDAITANTLAVIAVNFLGMREPLAQLRELLAQYRDIVLIEDNAQWFPESDEMESLSGDFVVFSFGRGKPVSLLGGGLLLSRSLPATDTLCAAQESLSATVVTQLKSMAYNVLLVPQAYQLLARNPLIKLGETRYHPLPAVSAIDPYRLQILPANIEAYRTLHNNTQTLIAGYEQALAQHGLRNGLSVVGLSAAGMSVGGLSRCSRLLRYPLLLETTEQRNVLLNLLTKHGLGATAMYQKPLVEIDGMKPLIKAGRNPNATSFAARLITLPLHQGVSAKHRKLISQCFTALAH